MKLEKSRISFIGAGNMADALVKGLLQAKICSHQQIWVSDVNQERLNSFLKKYKVQGTLNNTEAMKKSEVVFLAVKPQILPGVLKKISGNLMNDKLFISIAAGISTNFIESQLGGKPSVVRVMPNTPALAGKGVAGIAPGKYANKEALDLTRTLFEAVGMVVVVAEKELDAITALSGSGPAYVFYFLEAMLEAAESMGMDSTRSLSLICATFEGSLKMLETTKKSPDFLREQVTSKGGTTEAALQHLQKNKVKNAIREAVLAAHRRSIELSGSI